VRSAVPDVLGPGLRVVFVGINPGHASAAAAAQFANPRNDFWRLLHAAGLTPRQLGDTRVFVLPSASPANAAVPWEVRLRWFRELAALVASA
jgi:G:T/U-mismatch repair DNA glycosylase